MNQAEQHLAKCRELAPDPRAAQWAALGANCRAALCRKAGLPWELSAIQWSKIDPAHRDQLRSAAQRIIYAAKDFREFSGLIYV